MHSAMIELALAGMFLAFVGFVMLHFPVLLFAFVAMAPFAVFPSLLLVLALLPTIGAVSCLIMSAVPCLRVSGVMEKRRKRLRLLRRLRRNLNRFPRSFIFDRRKLDWRGKSCWVDACGGFRRVSEENGLLRPLPTGEDLWRHYHSSLFQVSVAFYVDDTANTVHVWPADGGVCLYDVLLCFPDHKFGADAEKMVETSSSANAATIAINEATDRYKSALKHNVRVRHNLKPAHRQAVLDMCDIPVSFGDQPLASDHVVLATVRDVIREVYSRLFSLQETCQSALVVGSSAREMKLYANSPGVEHYVHGTDAKDVDRTANQLLGRMARRMASKVTVGQPVVRHFTSKQLFEEYGKVTSKADKFIHTEFPNKRFNTLLYEDVHYELGWADYYRHFSMTGANVAYGYGLLPLELRWADMPSSQYYNVSVRNGRAYFSYRYGEANGYCHDRARWATFLEQPYASFPEFGLVAEVKVRMGPFVIFQITRTNVESEEHHRVVEIPKKYQYVRVLDVHKSFRGTALTRHDVYFSVFAEEAYEAINFAMSLADKSLTPEGVMTMIRRRSPGVSLTTQQLVAPWSLPDQYHFKLAYAACHYAIHSRLLAAQNVNKMGASPTVQFLKDQFTGSSFLGRTLLMKQNSQDLLDRLFVDVDGVRVSHVQTEYVKVSNPSEPVFVVNTKGSKPLGTDCEFCGSLHGKLGKQRIKCEPGPKAEVTFQISTQELAEMHNQLCDTDHDPAGIAEVKKIAKKATPLVGFHHKVNVHYIRGGPGTGKSYIIRQLVTERDLILSPLLALRTDYMNVKKGAQTSGTENVAEEAMELDFKTTHRAFAAVNKRRVFLDEFTLFDYNMLAVILHNCGAEELYIVGDHAQTSIQDEHGLSIIKGLETKCGVLMDELNRHTLMVNFRNPPFIVDMLNMFYGYEMVSAQENDKDAPSPFTWLSPAKFRRPDVPLENSHYMAFTHAECYENDIPGNTVKTSQGKTYDHVVLFVGRESSTSKMKSMQIVALSRHRKTLTIVGEKKDVVAALPIPDREGETWLSMPKSWAPETAKRLDPAELSEIPVTMDDVLHEEGFVPDFEPADPFYQGYYNGHIYVNPWVVYLVVKAVFHLVAEICNAGHFIRYFDMATTGMLTHRTGANVGPAYFSFLVFMFCYRAALHFLVGWFGWVPWALSVFSPFSVDRFDVWLVNFMTTKLFLYLVNVTAYVTYMYRIYSINRLHPHKSWKISLSWIQPDIGRTVAVDLETGRVSETYINRGTPLWTNLSETFKSLHFLVPWSGKEVVPVPTALEVEEVAGESPEPFDSHLSLADLIPRGVPIANWISAMNEWSSLIVRSNFRTGRVRIADLVAPLNRRNNVKGLISTFRAFSVGNGVKFWDSPMQTLGVLSERYFAKKREVNPTPDQMEKVAEKVVQLFFTEHMQADKFDITDSEIEEVMSKYIPKAIAKHYPAQAMRLDEPGTREIRLHIKQILKPASETKPIDLYKPGQGISAWHKNAQIVFGCGALVVYEKFRKGFKDHVIFDNGMTPDELKAKTRQVLNDYASDAGATNCIADGKMFDANQDAFTQLLESKVYQRLGASREWVDLYMSHRANYKLHTPYASGTAGTEKTSGEPFTLLGNTIVAATIANYLFRGDGPMLVAMKGDDFWKRQVGVYESGSNARELATVTRLLMKSYVADNAEFTGYTIIEGEFIESIPRKLAKVSGHEFRSYEHFTQYQESLRDWVRMTMPARSLVEAANAQLFNMPLTTISAMYSTLVSLSHINQEQFMELSHEYTRFEATLLGVDGRVGL